jgi:hypothetical protein
MVYAMLWCVQRPEKCENNQKSSKIGQFFPILATFYQFKKNVKIAEKVQKLVNFCHFLPILATFYQF